MNRIINIYKSAPNEEALNYRQIKFGNSLASVLLIYFMGISVYPESRWIEVGWIAVSISLILFHNIRFWIPIILFHVVLALFYLIGSADSIDSTASTNYLRTFAAWTLFTALLFATLHSPAHKIGKKIEIKIYYILQILLLTAISIWALVSLRYLNDKIIYDLREITGQSYLTIADLFAMFSISVLVRPRLPFLIFAFIVFCSILTLFFISSRSSLILFSISIIAFYIARFSFVKSFTLAIPLIIVSGFYLFQNFGQSGIQGSRLISLIDSDYDVSALSRAHFRDQMISNFINNPTCLIMPCPPPSGMYDHSILSLIQYFGLAGMLLIFLYTFVCIRCAKFIYKSWYFPLFLYCIMSLIMSRSWVSVTFPVSLALIIDVIYRSIFDAKMKYNSKN